MSGYLDEYGAGEARRAQIIKRIAGGLALLAIIAGVLYFLLRDYQEKRQVTRFFNLLAEQQYREAYALWGCTEASPCVAYPFENFMEDWGPDGLYPAPSEEDITDTLSCSDGIIQTLSGGAGDEVWLWVGRADKVIGYAPQYGPEPACNPLLPKGRIEGR